MPDVGSVSLLDELSQSGFRSSIIATYNCYFPFYEEVVLRRMVASGCTHNILLVDARWCAAAYASDETRPRRAGTDYTLIPVRLGGAFHPKIHMRIGTAKGAMFVGSHNMTLSGFGLNDELTAVFRAEGSSARASGATFVQALDFLSSFVPSSPSDLMDAFTGASVGIPWLEGPAGFGDARRTLLVTTADTESLWSQLAPHLPRKKVTAFVAGPFFDSGLSLLRRIAEELHPVDLVVGIDPASVEIDPGAASSLGTTRFVNVAGAPAVTGRREQLAPYLHAKALWFKGADGELLVTGSANPSAAAFLAPAAVRNAEAVVADRRPGSAAGLGLDALFASPVVTASDWSAIADRRRREDVDTGDISTACVLATPAPGGFSLSARLPAGRRFVAFGEGGCRLGTAVVADAGRHSSLTAPDEVSDRARFLESAELSHRTLVIVHRAEEIGKNIGSDRGKALRQVLGALDEDPAQLDALLKLTEKVIFDSEHQVPSAVGSLKVSPMNDEAADASAPASLVVDAAGRPGRTRRRRLASGDILVLLDALIRRLGEGGVLGPGARDNRDEEVGADEEDGGDLGRPALDHADLARACRGRVRRLVRRMEQQIETAALEGEARRGVVRLAAVLGVVRMLRYMDRRSEWRRRQLRLVEPEDEWHLLDFAAFAVAYGPASLAKRAVAECQGEDFEELSLTIGLLAWLAWDSDVDIDVASRRAGREGVEEELWEWIDLFVFLAPFLALDPVARAVLEESVARTPRVGADGKRWLVVHLQFAQAVLEAETAPESCGVKGRVPRPGDLVIMPQQTSPRVRLILDVVPAGQDAKIVFSDPDDEDGRRTFLASRVRTLSWGAAGASDVASRRAR